MKIETTPLGPDRFLVAFSGRLDIAGTAQVEAPFGVIASQASLTLVDLTGTPFVASVGIRLLLANAKALYRRSGRMIVFGCDPQVEKVLRSTGVDQLIPIVATRDEALVLAGEAATAAPPPGTGAS